MIKRKLGIIADCIVGKDPVSSLKLIKEAGLECFFTHHTDAETVALLKKEGDCLGLEFEFVHGPYHGCNVVWEDSEKSQAFVDDVLRCIRVCADNQIKTIILHVSSGWTPPPVNELGFSRFDQMVALADTLGVNIAFENLRRLDNFSALMERYKDAKNVGFCYDIGHEHCYTRTVQFLDYFGDRLTCTHVHDNLGFEGNKNGNDDMHVLPFDGDIDFQTVMDKLNACNYRGSLMLEAFNGSPYGEDGFPAYKHLSPQEFIRLAFERATALSKM